MKLSRFSILTKGFFLAFMTLFFALSAFSQVPTVKPLFTFPCDSKGKNCPEGSSPSRLIQSADGNFYGATAFGGTGNLAAGTIFRLTPSGQLTTLHTFVADQSGNYPSGADPTGVVEGIDGFLYGSTFHYTGGVLGTATGVVFKLSKAGAFQILYSGTPVSSLTFGSDGDLYGFGSDSSGNTAVVRMTLNGAYQVLHTLNPHTDGIYPAGLILGSDGNLYGTTVGAEAQKITSLFRFTPAGQFTVLRTIHYGQFFTDAPTQSENGNFYAPLDFVVQPNGSLPPGFLESDLTGTGFHLIALPYPLGQTVGVMLEASDGNFWTSSFGSSFSAIVCFTHSGAAVHQIELAGTGLVQASDGRILGEAGNEIFAIEPALPAPKSSIANFTPGNAKAGAPVLIHGNHFVGTTAVTVNEVSAPFHVLNNSTILFTVPAGAVSGPIEVTNAGGETTNSQNFIVDF